MPIAARMSRGLSRSPHVLGLFNGTAGTHSSSCLYRQPTMRISLRRRRNPEPAARRDIHSSRQRPKSPPQSKKIQWFSIPVTVGVGVVGLVHLYKTYKTKGKDEAEQEQARQDQQQANERDEIREDNDRRPKKRGRIRPDGPW